MYHHGQSGHICRIIYLKKCQEVCRSISLGEVECGRAILTTALLCGAGRAAGLNLRIGAFKEKATVVSKNSD